MLLSLLTITFRQSVLSKRSSGSVVVGNVQSDTSIQSKLQQEHQRKSAENSTSDQTPSSASSRLTSTSNKPNDQQDTNAKHPDNSTSKPDAESQSGELQWKSCRTQGKMTTLNPERLQHLDGSTPRPTPPRTTVPNNDVNETNSTDDKPARSRLDIQKVKVEGSDIKIKRSVIKKKLTNSEKRIKE
jgi:hypothetical protein